MKYLQKLFLAFLIITGLSACGGNDFKGIYTCENCLYSQLNFKQDGTVEISVGEIKAQGEFEVTDKTITVTTETAEYIFMMKDATTLEGKEDAEGTYIKK